jgi:hypothetical protein
MPAQSRASSYHALSALQIRYRLGAVYRAALIVGAADVEATTGAAPRKRLPLARCARR